MEQEHGSTCQSYMSTSTTPPTLRRIALAFSRDIVVFQGSGTSGCQNRQPPRTISHDCSYHGLKTYSKKEII
jgi:hypothetical protein